MIPMLLALSRNRSPEGAAPLSALPPDVAVVGLIQSERELNELTDMQAIQRWVCHFHTRLNPSRSVGKAF